MMRVQVVGSLTPMLDCWSDPASAFVDIWGVNRQLGSLSVYLSLSLNLSLSPSLSLFLPPPSLPLPSKIFFEI